MEVLLTKDDESEILRYLGYRGSEYGDEISNRMDKCIEIANKIANIRYTYKLFDLVYQDDGIEVVGGAFKLTGDSIRKHLKGAKRAAFMCVTLGRDFDSEIEKMMILDPAAGVILNAAGIAFIEKAADSLQKLIDETLSDGYHTGVRFSPGYGDLPLESQSDFIRILNAEKYAGVRLNASFLMSPVKSVTAIAAIER